MTALPTEKHLRAASTRAAIMTTLGAAAVIISLVYAGASLRTTYESLAEARTQLDTTQTSLKLAQTSLAETTGQLTKSRQQLEQATCALQSSRAAIQAFHQQQYQTAAELYSQALTCDPENAYLLNLMAYTQFKMRRLSDAIAYERRSVETDPGYAWGYFDLARFLCAVGSQEAENAKTAIARALALRPGLREIMRNDGEFMTLCRPIVGNF